MPVVVRRASAEDVLGIAQVHWDSHQTTYVDSGRVDRELIEAWTLDDRVARWTKAVAVSLGDAEPDEGAVRSDVWVAVDDDRVIGWAESGPPRDHEAPRELELHGLYVLDAYHGTGVGQRLLDAAIGDQPALVWALGGAPTRARAFYRRNGFEPDGTDVPFEYWNVRAVRMVR